MLVLSPEFRETLALQEFAQPQTVDGPPGVPPLVETSNHQRRMNNFPAAHAPVRCSTIGGRPSNHKLWTGHCPAALREFDAAGAVQTDDLNRLHLDSCL